MKGLGATGSLPARAGGAGGCLGFPRADKLPVAPKFVVFRGAKDDNAAPRCIPPLARVKGRRENGLQTLIGEFESMLRRAVIHEHNDLLAPRLSPHVPFQDVGVERLPRAACDLAGDCGAGGGAVAWHWSVLRGGFAFAQYDLFVIRTIVGVGLLVMMAQGVVCGAQLFAGEKDAGSLAFLDMLSSRGVPVWRTKLLVGTVLTLLQALVLGCIMLVLNLGTGTDLPWFIIVGWVALLWGTVAGALCDRVFPAILLGIVFVVGNFAVPVLVPIRPELLQIALAAIPLMLSYRIFCADDRDRLLKVRKDKETGRQRPIAGKRCCGSRNARAVGSSGPAWPFVSSPVLLFGITAIMFGP